MKRSVQSGLRPLLGALLLCLGCSGSADSGGGDGSPASGGAGDEFSGDGGTDGSGGLESVGGQPSSGGQFGEGGGAATGGLGGDPLEPDWNPVEQLDLLFVVDNSVSMADKQEMLIRAVPVMVERLVNPPCVSPEGTTVAATNGNCPDGFALEYAPVDDMHIGVISSSLGGNGARQCYRDEPSWNNDDQGHLIATVRADVQSSDPLGFLAWSGGDATASAALVAAFTEQISAVGELGCGYEAPLEAFYRFLVDPQPPQDIILGEDQTAVAATDVEGNVLVDEEVLAQRAAFLRPESLVNVVVLTDENDCSMMGGGSHYPFAGFGFLVAEATFDFPIATAECEDNPNDRCCLSCLQRDAPPDGCEGALNVCLADATIRPAENRPNVRCFDTKRRFGIDLLYPTDRYVNALLQRRIIDARDGTIADNPLLTGAGANAGTLRPHGRVYLTGIVGVPWQDLVTDESLADPDVFEYLTADELRQTFDHQGTMVSRWDVMVGRPGLSRAALRCQVDDPPTECGLEPRPPLDPFMIESIDERADGLENPISGDLIVASTSNDPTANSINGHEVNNLVVDGNKYIDGGPVRDALQYACIFPLDVPKVDCEAGNASCDCGDEPLRNRPVCQPPAGGAATTTQYYAKAYPGTRILEVLRDFGENSIVSSICPKDASEGYEATISTMLYRIKERFPAAD